MGGVRGEKLEKNVGAEALEQREWVHNHCRPHPSTWAVSCNKS